MKLLKKAKIYLDMLFRSEERNKQLKKENKESFKQGLLEDNQFNLPDVTKLLDECNENLNGEISFQERLACESMKELLEEFKEELS